MRPHCGIPMWRGRGWKLALAAALLASDAGAAEMACSETALARTEAQHFLAREPLPTPTGLDARRASCVRAGLDAVLRQQVGPVIGYKVALTSAAMQQRFHTREPVWGRLYAGSLYPHDSDIASAFGARPRLEADLLVRVGNPAVNQARTPGEILATLDAVIPFIELPDLMLAQPAQLDADVLTALNAGARAGVTGADIPVPRDPAARQKLVDALRDMTVTLRDGKGQVLGEGRGRDMLGGHPLTAVRWLAQKLAAQGEALKPGDLISLGSFSPLVTPLPGMVVTVSYAGLPGPAEVRARFH